MSWPTPNHCLTQLERDGFVLLPAVFSPVQVDSILAQLESALNAHAPGAILTHAGTVYAARNILELWPAAAAIWRQPLLQEILARILGTNFGLVRVLYFDKPPEQTWALPWHKDLTIAVKRHGLPSHRFSKPTRKAGVPHVEAPREILEEMLTARIHLDDVTEENGPLKVVPGSHLSGKEMNLGDTMPRMILAERGGVLLIRPLVAHCSNRSQAGTKRHRRILHFEFAGSAMLPDGYAWHNFIR
jgi:ectoine hydroxylase-related dioxygenase (phytanoyl-CoA dioxygenase family)